MSVGVAILAALTSASHCSLPLEFIAIAAVVGGVVVVVAAVAMLAIVACEFFAANVGIFQREFSRLQFVVAIVVVILAVCCYCFTIILFYYALMRFLSNLFN